MKRRLPPTAVLLCCLVLLAAPVWLIPTVAAGATKIKTVEFFAFQYSNTTDIAASQGLNGAYLDANDIVFNVNIPESPITVRAAWIEWRTDMLNTNTTGEMKFARCTAAPPCTAASARTVNTIQTLGSIDATGARAHHILLRMDVTSQIIAGNNDYMVNATVNIAWNTDAVKLVVTYEYPDTAATQLKTVKYTTGCLATQAAAGTTNNFTVNPNITDTGATVVQHWVEYTADINGTTKGSFNAVMNATAGPAGSNTVSGAQRNIFVMNSFAKTNINLTTNNTIGLTNTTIVANLKCAEWVVTYTTTAITSGTPLNTARYRMGQLSGSLVGTAQNVVGSQAINLPEALPASAFRSVWIRYTFGTLAAGNFTPEVKIGANAAVTGAAHAVDFTGTRGAGYNTVLYDITSTFQTQWTNGATVEAHAAASVANTAESVNAELIITYGFTAASTVTGIKTAWWNVGQDTADNAANVAFTGTFNTFIPETGTITKRSSAVMAFFAMDNLATTNSTTIGGAAATNAAYGIHNRGAGSLPMIDPATALTNVSQTAVTFSLNSSGTIFNAGAVGYTTYEYPYPSSVLNNFLVEQVGGGAIGTQTAGTAFSIKITARDAGNNTVTGFTGTVTITSTGTLSAGGGTTLAFTAGVLASHSVTISNSGTFTITATKTAGTESGTSNSFLECGAVSEAEYVAANAQSGQAIVYWSSANPVIILRKTAAFAGEAPANGTGYSAGGTIGAATVVFTGTGGETSFTQTGLGSGTYSYKVFAKTGSGAASCYAPGGGGTEANAKLGGASAGIALVQDAPIAQGSTVTTLTATFAANITAGNAVIATFSSNVGGTVTSVTGGGVTWTQAVTVQIGTSENLYIYYGTNSSGGTKTVTINGTSDNWVLEVSEWSGLANSGTLDVTGSATGTSASPSSGNVTTTNANDLLIAFETDFTGVPPTAGPTNSFTALNSGSVNQPHNPAYRIVSATGTYNTGWTIGSTSWGGVIAAFKAAPTTTGEAWSYMLSGGSILKGGTASGTGTIYATSNASRIVSLNTSNGTQSWAPLATNAQIQAWLTWLPVGSGGIKSVQSGTATMTTQALLDVPITAVTLARSILFFSVQEDNSDPVNAHIRGQLTSSTNIQFNRQGTATTITIKWYVAEFYGGVSVQRGTTATSLAVTNVTLSPVNLAKTFVLISRSEGGTGFNVDDLNRARLTSSTNLELSVGGAGGGGTVDWQVVSMAAASVQSGDVSFLTTEASKTVTVTSVDSTKSFLLTTWNTDTNLQGIGPGFMRGRITSPTVLTFDRGVTGWAINLTWFLVTLNDGSTVQSGNRSFTAADTSLPVTLSPAVVLTRSVAFLSGNQRGGSTPYLGDTPATADNPGVAWFTADLTTGTNLQLTRAVTLGATAEAAWFVVQFPQTGGSPVVIGADLPLVADTARVYSVDPALAITNWPGATMPTGWSATGLPGADQFQAAPAVQVRQWSNAAFQAAYTDDVIFAATLNTQGTSTTNNKVFALGASNGALLWTFSGTMDGVTGMPYVDYARNRLYVASRAGSGGTQQSLWVINTLNGTVVPCSGTTCSSLGHLQTAPTLSNDGNTIYVGNTAGSLYAIDANTLAAKWSPSAKSVGAEIKGFVWEDPGTNGRLYFGTWDGTAGTGNVWCVQDPGPAGNPTSARCPGWTVDSVAVPGPQAALVMGGKLFVGSWNSGAAAGQKGKLYQINLSNGNLDKTVVVGDGERQPGDVTSETGSEIFVGTTEGKIFKFVLTGGSL